MRSLTLGIATTMLLGASALSTPAFATGNNNGGGSNQNHTCQGGHNCNTYNDNDTYNNTYNKGGTGVGVGVGIGVGGEGGEGGKGGAGGHGYGGSATNMNKNDANNTNINAPIAHGGEGGKAYGGTAYGGKVENDNRDYNHIDNTDLNVNLNAQKNTIKDSANNRNYNTDYNHNKNEQDQDQKQKQKQQQQQKQTIKDSGNSEIKNSGNSYNKNQNDNSNSNNADQEVNVNTYNERAPVNTAYAAGLSAGEDTCMGSSSIGAQAVSFGLSIGTTWQDDNCRRLKNSRQMVALGYHRAATALMCVDADVEAAMARAGTPCPNGAVVAAAPVYYQEAAPARSYVPMAPVADPPKKKRRVRKALPPK